VTTLPAGAARVSAHCDLLVASCDAYVQEAEVTIRQLVALGFAENFAMHIALGDRNLLSRAVPVLRSDPRGTWSSALSQVLAKLDRPYVLLWLDDFVPTKVVSLAQLQRLVDWTVHADANYLRINPTPRGSGAIVAPNVREIPSGSPYRTSTILSIWRRTVLMDLLDPAESAWQFEVAGSVRSDRLGGFFAHDVPLVDTANLVVKGLIDPRAERMLRNQGIDLSSLTRPRMSVAQLLSLIAWEALVRLLVRLPWSVQRVLRAARRSWFVTGLVSSAYGS